MGIEGFWINKTQRTPTRIPIHTRPIDKPERVGLGVAADGWIIVAVPVVVQARRILVAPSDSPAGSRPEGA